MSVFFDKVAQRLDKLDAADRRRQFRQLADEIGFFESVFDTLKEGVIVASPTCTVWSALSGLTVTWTSSVATVYSSAQTNSALAGKVPSSLGTKVNSTVAVP